mmetsp:Transcript_14264/g.51313  ORF Transcript_14264/g.51313 Transcript_14264/m.51313 type:complete len:299 (+) Transcript_14264:284-1180(+)
MHAAAPRRGAHRRRARRVRALRARRRRGQGQPRGASRAVRRRGHEGHEAHVYDRGDTPSTDARGSAPRGGVARGVGRDTRAELGRGLSPRAVADAARATEGARDGAVEVDRDERDARREFILRVPRRLPGRPSRGTHAPGEHGVSGGHPRHARVRVRRREPVLQTSARRLQRRGGDREHGPERESRGARLVGRGRRVARGREPGLRPHAVRARQRAHASELIAPGRERHRLRHHREALGRDRRRRPSRRHARLPPRDRRSLRAHRSPRVEPAVRASTREAQARAVTLRADARGAERGV